MCVVYDLYNTHGFTGFVFMLFSFGQCILTNIRDDKCLITEHTELLRVSHLTTFIREGGHGRW